jgi:hypothetical protein
MMLHSLGVWHRTGDGYTLQSTTDLLRTNFHSKSVTHVVLSVAQSVLDSGRFAASNEDGRLCVCLLSVVRIQAWRCTQLLTRGHRWFWQFEAQTPTPRYWLTGQSGSVSAGYTCASVQSISHGRPPLLAVGTRTGLVQARFLSLLSLLY